jgi:hypothetical protein
VGGDDNRYLYKIGFFLRVVATTTPVEPFQRVKKTASPEANAALSSIKWMRLAK